MNEDLDLICERKIIESNLAFVFTIGIFFGYFAMILLEIPNEKQY